MTHPRLSPGKSNRRKLGPAESVLNNSRNRAFRNWIKMARYRGLTVYKVPRFLCGVLCSKFAPKSRIFWTFGFADLLEAVPMGDRSPLSAAIFANEH